jgi:hypothetical protein
VCLRFAVDWDWLELEGSSSAYMEAQAERFKILELKDQYKTLYSVSRQIHLVAMG